MSQTPIIIADHVDIALGNLLEQYADRPRVIALTSAVTAPLQVAEDAFVGMLTLQTINGAIGIQLDKIGVIVGQPRNGLADEPYRTRIKIRILQNISQGEPDTLITVYQALTNSNYVIIENNYPAGVRLFSGGSIPEGQNTLVWENIQEIAAAGVRVDAISTVDSALPFCFGGGQQSLGAGFGDASNPSVGGPMANRNIPGANLFAFAGGAFDNLGFGDHRDPVMGGLFTGAAT